MKHTRNKTKLYEERTYKKAIDISIDSIPEDISIFNLSPFEKNGMNKRFILSCMNLHPVFNTISLRANGDFIPITDKIHLMAYFGGISSQTIDHFFREMLEKNILIMFNISNFACMYMINPDFAINKNNNSNLVKDLFEYTSKNRELYDINEQYKIYSKRSIINIKDRIKLEKETGVTKDE